MAVFRVIVEPHCNDVEQVSIEPHPVHRCKARIGYCRVRSGEFSFGWLMPEQHRLKPSQLALAEELLREQLRERAESQDSVSQRQEADSC